MTKCPFCEGMFFKLAEANITGATYKMYWVQCSSCLKPITLLSQYDPGVEGRKTYDAAAEVLSVVKSTRSQMNTLASVVSSLEAEVRKLRNKVGH